MEEKKYGGKQHFMLSVYKNESDQPGAFLDKINKGDCYCQFNSRALGGEDLAFVEHLQFDNNLRCLVAYGTTQIFILDLETRQGKVHSLASETYEKILHINYTSDLADPAKTLCSVACKRKDEFQICVFNLFDLPHSEAVTPDDDEVVEDKGQGRHLSLNFEHEPTEHLMVRISKNNKQIIFTDNHEKFIVDLHVGYSEKRKLASIEGKIVMYIQEDPAGTGFYVVCCKEYDSKIDVEHSHRPALDIAFDRQVEPGIIKIHDMNIRSTALDAHTNKNEIRFVGMRDDEFTLDRATYTERKLD